MKTTLHKVIVIVLLSLCFAMLGFVIFLDEYFYRTRPTEPNPESGRIYPQFIHHGTRVYLTRTEQLPFEFFFYPFIGFAALAYFLNQRWRCIQPFSNK